MRVVRRWHLTGLLLGAVLVALATPRPAEAAFHFMKVREVRTAGASGSYVMLQMWTSGQNFVSGHDIAVYNSNGTLNHNYTMGGNVSSGQNQKTVLIAGPGYSGPTADFTDASLNLPATGGAVCFSDAEPVDCVSWGNFSGSLPAPGAGSPASPGGVTTGMALHRSIAPNCSTLLEPADDTNNSSTDFSEQTPNPRPNSAAVVETECNAPNTSIGTKPPTRTNSTTAEFTFTATPSAGATFECKLDTGAFEVCTSPKEYTGLDGDNSASGTAHKFEVRAKNSEGTDATPAVHNWTVDTVKPTTTITSQPADPSAGTSAKFNFSANESVSKYECSLAKGAAADSFSTCASGKTYTSLADDSYTFKVKATDLAANAGDPDTYTWTVDNSLVDVTPPETTIVSKPPDPSESQSASFTYESNEPGSTFECKLDGEGFASCPVAGKTYSNLSEGPHTFQVRAKDESGNVDGSPAGHSWSISIPDPPPPPAAPPPPVVPQTIITSKPRAVTRDRTPTFRFRSNVAGSTYQCKLDRGPFRGCRSPFTTKALTFRRHLLLVRAVAGGMVDPTPARSSFKVVKKKKKKARKRKRQRSR